MFNFLSLPQQTLSCGSHFFYSRAAVIAVDYHIVDKKNLLGCFPGGEAWSKFVLIMWCLFLSSPVASCNTCAMQCGRAYGLVICQVSCGMWLALSKHILLVKHLCCSNNSFVPTTPLFQPLLCSNNSFVPTTPLLFQQLLCCSNNSFVVPTTPFL